MRSTQIPLWADDPASEDPEYLSRQLITYIGNKRTLLGHISRALEHVEGKLRKRRLAVFDAFSGSGIVSRFLKSHSSRLISNDIEDYAAVIGRCYLCNRSTVDLARLSDVIDDMNARCSLSEVPGGFIQDLYAPKDDAHIRKEDRVFYTRENARRLDNYRQLIDSAPDEWRDLLLGPLLSEASLYDGHVRQA